MKPGTSASWRKLLAEPGDDGHIVQLYQDDDFYGEAISHFTAEGLARDESIILVATGLYMASVLFGNPGFAIARWTLARS